jgi:hypothetical protein
MNNEKQSANCGCMGAGPAFTDFIGRLGPRQARDHFRAARVEFLKGLRALIDARIDHLSKSKEAQTGTTVPVE